MKASLPSVPIGLQNTNRRCKLRQLGITEARKLAPRLPMPHVSRYTLSNCAAPASPVANAMHPSSPMPTLSREQRSTHRSCGSFALRFITPQFEHVSVRSCGSDGRTSPRAVQPARPMLTLSLQLKALIRVLGSTPANAAIPSSLHCVPATLSSTRPGGSNRARDTKPASPKSRLPCTSTVRRPAKRSTNREPRGHCTRARIAAAPSADNISLRRSRVASCRSMASLTWSLACAGASSTFRSA